MLTVLSIALGVLVVITITVFTGYFVAQEFAYMAVDRSRLKARAEAGDAAASRALSITRRTSFMLSGAQLGITVTGLLVGYVAEPLIGRGLGELLGGVGIPTAVGVAVGAVLAVLFSTVVQMVFGELFPKNLAIARPEPVARWLSRSTTIYLTLFGWLIKLFDASSNLLLRALRIDPVHDVEHSATARDLEHIVAESRETGELPRELSTLLDRILDFPTRTAEHAMIPRAHADVVDADEPVGSVLAKMATGHTRYPVTGTSPDDLLGVVHLHDLLDADPDDIAGETVPVRGDRADDDAAAGVLAQLTTAKEEMALVIDEYGGFAGVLTTEDMAEELVGEIADEHDPDFDDAGITRDDDGWLIAGDVHLDEVARTLGHHIPEGTTKPWPAWSSPSSADFPPSVTASRSHWTPTQPNSSMGATPRARVLRAEVRAVERHVPDSVFVVVERRPRFRQRGDVVSNPLVLLAVTVGLIAASAFFVAVEFALIAARRSRLEDAAPHSRAARAALRSASELSVLLAGSQLGITVCTLALGAVTKPAVHHWLTPPFTLGAPRCGWPISPDSSWHSSWLPSCTWWLARWPRNRGRSRIRRNRRRCSRFRCAPSCG